MRYKIWKYWCKALGSKAFDEDDKADNVIACDDEFPKGLNHLTRSSRAGVALHQYNSGRGNVQPEP